ncbi:Heparin sulfate O-sulfotransferase [Mesorhizobium loti]|nr:Heparin sulfate O-sulfotransferase [Mesorhizobium loti]
MLLDRADRGGFIVDGQRDDFDARIRELCAGALEPRELGLAIRAPSTPIDQDDAIRMYIVPPPTAGTSRVGKAWPFCKRVITDSMNWTIRSNVRTLRLDCQVQSI